MTINLLFTYKKVWSERFPLVTNNKLNILTFFGLHKWFVTQGCLIFFLAHQLSGQCFIYENIFEREMVRNAFNFEISFKQTQMVNIHFSSININSMY